MTKAPQQVRGKLSCTEYFVTVVPTLAVPQNHPQSFEKQGFPSPTLELKLLGDISGVINFSDDTDTQPGRRTPASHPSPKVRLVGCV